MDHLAGDKVKEVVMPKHFNPSIGERSLAKFRFKGNDNLSSNVAEVIQPTVEISPYANIIRHINLTNGTAATIYTTPTDKDFYLTSCMLSFVKDATATTTIITLRGNVGGANYYFIYIGHLTLTADSNMLAMAFPVPIKIDRGTNIQITSSTGVANIYITASIQGYTEETQISN